MKTRSKPVTRPRTKTRTEATRPTSSASGEDGAPPPTGSEEQYRRFLPEARALPAAEVLPFRANGALLYHNVFDGVSAIVAERERLAAELQRFPMASVEALPDLALGLIFAAHQVDRDPASTGAIPALLSEAFRLREAMLTAAEALALQQLLPSPRVERIRTGSGPIDLAQDLVDLAALYRERAPAIRGKHPVTSQQIQRAAELGTELLKLLKPRALKRKPDADAALAQQVADRDRLFTLVVRRYDLVRRAGAWLFGDDVNQRVPRLQGRRRRLPRSPSPPPTDPSPTPAPAPTKAA